MRRVVLVAVGGLSFGLAACGTAGGTSASAGSTAGPSIVEFSDAVTLGKAVESTAKKGQTAQVTLRSRRATGESSGEGSVETDHSGEAVQFTLDSPTEVWTVVSVDGRMFLARQGVKTASGRTWTRLDPASADPRQRVISALVSGFPSFDPRQVGADVATAGTVTGSAADQVDGRDVARYTVDIEKARLPRGAFGLGSAGFQDAEPTFPVEVWVDRGGRIARFNVHFAGKKHPDIGFTVDYRNWGKGPGVSAPDPADVEPNS
ncbi:hypothetical protein [Actinokineospora inagensis]|uniref:hypothetical protein n=1 Tax=Actinokineospora inagensis TaxID=103730 RepID=UPI0012FC828B|nr:hypothetical protein [Actinokineospora inagensis]